MRRRLASATTGARHSSRRGHGLGRSSTSTAPTAPIEPYLVVCWGEDFEGWGLVLVAVDDEGDTSVPIMRSRGHMDGTWKGPDKKNDS